MRKFRKISLLFLSIIMAVSFTACVTTDIPPMPEPPDNGTTKTYSKYDLVKLGNIGLAPVGVYSSLYMDDAHFADIKNANFNIVNTSSSQTSSTELTQKVLSLCDKQGLKALIEDSVIKSAIGDIRGTAPQKNEQELQAMCDLAISSVAKYYDYDSYAGSVMCDEPFANAFTKLSRLADSLTKEFDKVYGVNMFPNGGNGFGAGSDEKYIETWIQPVSEGGYGQPLYSYDDYCLLNNNIETNDYFRNLDMVRTISNKHDVPFWSYVLTTEHLSYRYPSENDLRWNLFSSVCFGSKLVKYYLFNSLNNNSAGITGLVDEFGEPTEKLAWVAKANGEVLKIGDKLVSSKCEGIMLVGNKEMQTSGLYSQSLTEYDVIKAVDVNGGAAAVGCFNDDDADSKSVMIVGETPRTNCTVTLTFDSTVTAALNVFIDGVPTKMKPIDGKLEIYLSAGSYAYIALP